MRVDEERVHIVLIGAGIMSATLGTLIKQLMPDARISILESLDRVAAESSEAFNNSGTGHAAYCELNYTPLSNGKINIAKALSIAQSFEVSKQFWAYLKENGAVSSPGSFINAVPHMSFVWGDENVDFLHKRYQAMCQAAIFQGMQYSSKPGEIQEWAPLIMEGRDEHTALAATKINMGTDVNFGAITNNLINYLDSFGDVDIQLRHKVTGFTKQKGANWRIQVKDIEHNIEKEVDADYVFIGAGGAALSLLKKTGIKEAKGYAGFPISGQFLTCSNPAVVNNHHAKVYGMAEVGAPPMSVPHLDTRIIDNQRILFFGPYAGFTTRFLKSGSYLDLFLSFDMDNVWPLISTGINNFDLTSYLVKQVMQSPEQRYKELLAYYPNARNEDWSLIVAGQRVQIIERVKGGGILKFGTEIISSEDGTIAALMGASPGASTSVTAMLDVVERMFPEKITTKAWQNSLKQMIPSYGESLIDNDELCLSTIARTRDILELTT